MPRIAGSPPRTVRVGGTSTSGDRHRLLLDLGLLRVRYCQRQIDLMTGQTRTPECLATVPNDRTPQRASGEGGFALPFALLDANVNLAPAALR